MSKLLSEVEAQAKYFSLSTLLLVSKLSYFRHVMSRPNAKGPKLERLDKKVKDESLINLDGLNNFHRNDY